MNSSIIKYSNHVQLWHRKVIILSQVELRSYILRFKTLPEFLNKWVISRWILLKSYLLSLVHILNQFELESR